MSQTSCSVIIIAYNSRHFLPSCLHSVFRALKQRPHQVIVVENGSPDPIPADVRQAYAQVLWIDSPQNLGFGKACNLAARHAEHPLLFFVNPDTVVSRDTFDQLIAYMENKPLAGAVGCRILNGDGSLQWACRRSFPSPMAAIYKTLGLAALFPKSRIFGAYNLTYLDPQQEAEVDAVSGSFFCVRKTVYEQVGGFDEDFFLYGEDLDICYRIQEAGYHNYYYPFTSVIHFKGQSSRTRMLRSYLDFYQAMLIFASKHKRFKPVPLWMIALGVFFAAALGIFSRLMPAWWKFAADTAWFAGISWGISRWMGVDFFMVWVSSLCAVAPLLLWSGDYGTRGLYHRGFPGIGAFVVILASFVLGWLGGLGLAIGLAVSLGVGIAWLWRRMAFWIGYFRGIFSGIRQRAVLLSGAPEVDSWFVRENLLSDRDILGCVSAYAPSEQARDHYLGHVNQLDLICARTGAREILVVPDKYGWHEEVLDEWIQKGRKDFRLAIGHPDTPTFALVDLYFLK